MILTDTIVAISTPPGRGGLGVVRLSGPAARRIADSILRAPLDWRPWQAHLAELIDDAGNTIDRVVATFFASPRSYTAEDVVDPPPRRPDHPPPRRHRAPWPPARASPSPVNSRSARYVNGRIDLPQAEAVRDLIDATTLYQARSPPNKPAAPIPRGSRR